MGGFTRRKEKSYFRSQKWEFKRRIDTLQTHSKQASPTDQKQTSNLKVYHFLCDFLTTSALLFSERNLEPLARPQLLAIIVKQHRNRAQRQADEPKQTIAPALEGNTVELAITTPNFHPSNPWIDKKQK